MRERKERTEKVKTIQAELMDLKRKLNFAKNSLNIAINRVLQKSESRQNHYLIIFNNMLDKLTEEQLEERTRFTENLERMNNSWNDFKNVLVSKVELVESYGTNPSTRIKGLYQVALLYGVSDTGELVTYSQFNQEGTDFFSQFEGALDAQKNVRIVQKEIENKQQEYNQFLYGG